MAPHFRSQECSNCGRTVKKSLSTRMHRCVCGCELQRDGKCLDPVQPVVDHNGALNILLKGLGTAGHVGTTVRRSSPSEVEVNASGDLSALLVDSGQSMKVES